MLELKKLLSSEKDKFLFSTTNLVMSILGKKIERLFHENMEPGRKLYQQLLCLYSKFASQSWIDLQEYIKCVNDIAQLSMRAFHLYDADIQIAKLQNIAVELSQNGSIIVSDLNSVTSALAVITEEIDIGIVIERFSDLLVDQMHTINRRTEAADYLLREQLPGEALSYLTSVCSGIVSAVVQCSITNSLVFDLQKETTRLCQSTYRTLSINCVLSNIRNRSTYTSQSSRRLTELYKDLKNKRGRYMHSMTEARILSRVMECSLIIMDVDKEAVITIPYPQNDETIRIIYQPPSGTFPVGQYCALVDEEVTSAILELTDDNVDEEDVNRLYSALDTSVGYSYYRNLAGYFVGLCIIDQPHYFGELLVREHHAFQIKLERVFITVE